MIISAVLVTGGLAFYASKHRRQQFWLLSNRQPGDPHLQVGDGEVDYKGGGYGVLVLQQQGLHWQLYVVVVLDPLIDVDQQLHEFLPDSFMLTGQL